MPTPLAKGILVTVTALVAAGVAVYQSPQFQEWMNTSRRKIAVALHNLGDEIQPRDAASPAQDDISMTEEVGEAAEERRRIARAEIMRRAALLESRRNSKDSQKPVDSFDTLVDQEGKLRMQNKNIRDQPEETAVASSTGVDIHSTQQLRRGKPSDIDGNRLQIDLSSDTVSHRSESVAQFTPTSERPHGDILFDPFSDTPVRAQSPMSASFSESSHTEDNASVYYTHPYSSSDPSQQPALIADLDDLINGDHAQHEVSSAASTAGSFSHVHEISDVSSDGTLSEIGAPSNDGIATPSSWSEIGSVISDNDAGHHNLL
ncbi:hypothetical protein N7493_005579 [Penicillium malachiteum]|uniref:Uncharacterized protein n=1 Tax=Penicillium malachiteum TaxID=1324776 RepID=A0AAD6HNN5_9EURO|nr:hypothetical protein N7493_005579 [Penicillium malachiteum]